MNIFGSFDAEEDEDVGPERVADALGGLIPGACPDVWGGLVGVERERAPGIFLGPVFADLVRPGEGLRVDLQIDGLPMSRETPIDSPFDSNPTK